MLTIKFGAFFSVDFCIKLKKNEKSASYKSQSRALSCPALICHVELVHIDGQLSGQKKKSY